MILIDAHVHIHDCFDLDAMLNGAYENFGKFAVPGRNSEGATAFLLLTEGRGRHRFREIGNQLEISRNWQAIPTREPISLRLEKKDCPGFKMFLIAGRQIVTAENLEVLALLSGEEYEEGLPLARTVTAVRNNGGFPALPWGAGKWLGRRKRVLHRLLAEEKTQPFFLADNGCRPWLWPFPAFAEKSGLKILAGTDPLPFPWEERRAGSFGSILAGNSAEIDENHPAVALRQLLANPRLEPQPYGSQQGALKFLRNQTAMQFYKRFSAQGCS